MNFTLTKPYQYAHMKIWFRENWRALPGSVTTEDIIYTTVRYSVELHVLRIDEQFKIHGERAERMATFRASMVRLSEIYEGLQVKENWDKPLDKLMERDYMNREINNTQ